MITLENEFYYEMKNFVLVAQGELSGEFKVMEEYTFGWMIVLDLEDGMSYIIKKQ